MGQTIVPTTAAGLRAAINTPSSTTHSRFLHSSASTFANLSGHLVVSESLITMPFSGWGCCTCSCTFKRCQVDHLGAKHIPPVCGVKQKPFLLHECYKESDSSSCCGHLGTRSLSTRWHFSWCKCLLGARTFSPAEPRLVEVGNTNSFPSGFLGMTEAGPLGPQACIVFLLCTQHCVKVFIFKLRTVSWRMAPHSLKVVPWSRWFCCAFNSLFQHLSRSVASGFCDSTRGSLLMGPLTYPFAVKWVPGPM